MPPEITNPAERHNIIADHLRALGTTVAAEPAAILAACRSVLPDATQSEILTAMKGLISQLQEDTAVSRAEANALGELRELLNGAPDNMTVTGWAHQLAAAADPRGQKILDALENPTLHEGVEITPRQLARRILALQTKLASWFKEQVDWNREIMAGSEDLAVEGVEDLSLRKPELEQVLAMLPVSVDMLDTLVQCMDGLEDTADINGLALSYARNLPDGVDGRAALRAFGEAVLHRVDRRPGALPLDDTAQAGAAPMWSSMLTDDGCSTPELRAAVLTEVIRQGAGVVGPIDYYGFVTNILAATSLPEEVVGHDIQSAVGVAIRLGVFTSPQHEAATGTISFGGDTTMTPSISVTSFIHSDDYSAGDDGEEMDS